MKLDITKYKEEFEKKFNVNTSEDFDEIPAYSLDIWTFIEKMAQEVARESVRGFAVWNARDVLGGRSPREEKQSLKQVNKYFSEQKQEESE